MPHLGYVSIPLPTPMMYPQAVPAVQPLELDELSATIVALYARHSREDDARIYTLEPPQYLRHFLVRVCLV
jgi:hypothetical protein